MAYADAHDPHVLRHYEGLIFKTALMLHGHVEDDLEDIQQILRIKVFRALLAFNPTRAVRLSRDNYVFMCLRDQAKDLAKRRKRRELYIEDLAPAAAAADSAGLLSRDWFDERYLSSSRDEVYSTVEDDDCLIPNTLSELEVEIVVLLYGDYRQTEIATRLGLGKRDMELAMRSIRQKLADWKPGADQLVLDAGPLVTPRLAA